MQAATYNLQTTRTIPVNVLLLFHAILGIGAAFIPFIAPVYIILFFGYSVLRILQYRNKDNYATYSVVYLVSYEMLFRMNRELFIYEWSKYSAIVIMALAIILNTEKRKLPVMPVLYFILLLPSISQLHLSTDLLRKYVSFNLSGPLSLAMAWLYFFDRKLSRSDFKRLILNIALPIAAAVPFIILKIPKLSSDIFTGESSKAFSGGFGPNQVSAMLGYGFFVICLAMLLKINIFTSRTFDFIVAFTFIGLGVLTFSRGGVITGIIAFILSTYIYIRSGKATKEFSRIFIGIVFFCGAGYLLWGALNKLSNKSITARYVQAVEGKQIEGLNDKYDLSGRDLIAESDINVFLAHPILGAGPSGTMLARAKKAHVREAAASHTEFTRLLGDHGLLGLADLIILFGFLYKSYRSRNTYNKIIMIGFASISILTMTHADMRLAMSGVAFGLAFIDVNLEDHPLERT